MPFWARRVPQECPPEVESLIARCMVEDPSARPSAKELVEALSALPASLVLDGDRLKVTATSTSTGSLAATIAALMGEGGSGSRDQGSSLGLKLRSAERGNNALDRASASSPLPQQGGAAQPGFGSEFGSAKGGSSDQTEEVAPPHDLAASSSAPPGLPAPCQAAGEVAPPCASGESQAASVHSAGNAEPPCGALPASAHVPARVRGGAVGGEHPAHSLGRDLRQPAGGDVQLTELRHGPLCDSAYTTAEQCEACGERGQDGASQTLALVNGDAAHPFFEAPMSAAPRVPGSAVAQQAADHVAARRRPPPPRIVSPFAAPADRPETPCNVKPPAGLAQGVFTHAMIPLNYHVFLAACFNAKAAGFGLPAVFGLTRKMNPEVPGHADYGPGDNNSLGAERLITLLAKNRMAGLLCSGRAAHCFLVEVCMADVVSCTGSASGAHGQRRGGPGRKLGGASRHRSCQEKAAAACA